MNAHYKKLAYERATLLALVRMAKEQFLPREGEEDPAQRIEVEDLPVSESTVPEDEVIEVVVKLQRLADRRGLEMSRYTHTLTENNDEQEWTAEPQRQAQGGSKGAGAPGKQGKTKGGAGGAQAPAAAGRGQQPAHPGAKAAVPATGGRP